MDTEARWEEIPKDSVYEGRAERMSKAPTSSLVYLYMTSCMSPILERFHVPSKDCTITLIKLIIIVIFIKINVTVCPKMQTDFTQFWICQQEYYI